MTARSGHLPGSSSSFGAVSKRGKNGTDLSAQQKSRALYLRAFLAVYFTLTGLNWAHAWPHPTVRFFAAIFGTDLSGTTTYIEAKQNAEMLSFLLQSPWRWLVLVSLAISCVLFVWDRFPRAAAWALFLAANAMAYSAGGRHFIFELCGCIVLAHAIGSSRAIANALRIDRHSLVLAMVFASFGAMYGAAAVSKVQNTGVSWANTYSLPLMLRHHAYFDQTESFPTTKAVNARVLPFLLRVFDRPSYWSLFFLASVLILEALSPFLILMEQAVPIAPFIWLALHVGMGFIIGIFSYSIMILLLILGFPPLRLESRARILGFAYGLSLILLAWILPVDRYRLSSVVYPFARVGMFSHFPGYDRQHSPDVWRLFFKDKNGGPISHSMLLGPTKHSAQILTQRLSIELPPLAKNGKGVCEFIRKTWRERKSMEPPSFQVWSREIKADMKSNRIYEVETKLWDCD